MKTLPLAALLLALLARALPAQQYSPETLAWPGPPATPRIRFLYAVCGKQDLGVKKSLWKQIVEFLFGEEKEVNRLFRPQGIATDAAGRIYITDPGTRAVHIVDVERKSYEVFSGDDTVAFAWPSGIAVAPDGWMYVSDPERGAVQVFDKDRDYRFSISAGLQRPTGLMIRDSVLTVVDTKASLIVRYDLRGRELSRFGMRGEGNGEFNYPVAVASEDAAGGELHVVDAMNFRIQTLRSDGTFASAFGTLGDGLGDFSRPKGVALDSDGHLYVTDALFDVVQVFDRNGGLLLAFGGSGTEFGRFHMPSGICFDGRDRLYVADSENARVQVFQYVK